MAKKFHGWEAAKVPLRLALVRSVESVMVEPVVAVAVGEKVRREQSCAHPR